MTSIVRTSALTKRYRRTALDNCTIDVPAGRVTGLIGQNGAGKSTLLTIAAGMLEPTSGSIEVCGGTPGSGREQLEKVGFVAQDTPTYSQLTVAEHLRMGAALNRRWDAALAEKRVAALGLDPRQKAGTLSGGQRAQLALTLCVAKRPELLLLDEPVAALDPLARRNFLSDLMEVVADTGMSVVLSSHLIADLERVCDHLVLLVTGQVRMAGDVDDLLATHHRLTGPRTEREEVPGAHVLHASHTERQTTLLVQADNPIDDPLWTVSDVSIEDLVLAHMEAAQSARALEVAR
ncbi:ABC transporter ATP-binding protein [Umezawaea sp.]|uniref:ABC transporter ATP-binding protein n=1 Tax=Umezawaea sp. TaxID=1955258 RepID=UPI002ED02DC2